MGKNDRDRQKVAERTAKFATVGEAANFLHLSRATIHNMIHVGAIPAKRFGMAVRIPWAWLEEQAQFDGKEVA